MVTYNRQMRLEQDAIRKHYNDLAKEHLWGSTSMDTEQVFITLGHIHNEAMHDLLVKYGIDPSTGEIVGSASTNDMH